MNVYKGFDFGPPLGPISSTGVQSPARWIEVKHPGTPLEPGGTEWIWADDPEPWNPSDPIGRKEGGGSSNPGTMRPPTMRLSTTPIKIPQDVGPIWLPMEGVWPGPAPLSCGPEARAKILRTYQEILSSPVWAKVFDQFPGLLDCIKTAWRVGVGTKCNGGTLTEVPELNFVGEPRGMTFSVQDLENDDPTDKLWFQRRLIQQLIWACGGSLLDAYGISSLPGDILFQELARRTGVLLLGTQRDTDHRGREIRNGEWLTWDPKTGNVFDKNRPDKQLIPNPSFRKVRQEAIRRWYRV